MKKNPKNFTSFGPIPYLYTSCDRYKNATEANNSFKVSYGYYKHLFLFRNAIRALLRTLEQFLCILRDLGGAEKTVKNILCDFGGVKTSYAILVELNSSYAILDKLPYI